jgi:hypothetical protein
MVQGLFAQGILEGLTERLGHALTKVRWLEQKLGVTPDEIAEKQRLKREVEADLFPFRVLALVWSGGVMLGEKGCNELDYAQLLKHVSEAGDLPDTLPAEIMPMLVQATRMSGLASESEDLFRSLGQHGQGEVHGQPLPYDLTFPEVFYPGGVPVTGFGFDAVLGNPPWERMLPADKEFFASFEFDVVNAPTKREREGTQRRLLADPGIAAQYQAYIHSFRADERIIDRLYKYQQVEVEGEVTIGKQDAFRVFMERFTQLVRPGGYVGLVVPSAFHANEGATGVRQLYLTQMALTHCYSFENRRKLFEIHRSFKFANVVARRDVSGTTEFQVGFYLHDDEWLFGETRQRQPLTYTLNFVKRTGGDYLSLLELRSQEHLDVAEVCFRGGESFSQTCEQSRIQLGRELNMTDDAWRFTPTSDVVLDGVDPRDPEVAAHLLRQGYIVLHEGKTFRQYDDHWGERPRYVVHLRSLQNRPASLRAAQHYRATYRNIAGPGDENVSIWVVYPPAVAAGETGRSEISPWSHPSSLSLGVVGFLNAYIPDWLLQLRVRSHLNKFMLDSTPVISAVMRLPFVVHSALRLTCNHAGYAPLWREQLGDAWREQNPPFTWPVLPSDDDRWQVRAAIDALVADAYGLNRDQYAHVLLAFSHKSYPKAPSLCLEKFDELKRIGLDAFTKKHDPYHDIPLNENLPQPVIESPAIPAEGGSLFDRPSEEREPEDAGGVKQGPVPSGRGKVSRLKEEPTAAGRAGKGVSRKPRHAALDSALLERLKALLTEQQVVTSADAQKCLGLKAAGVRPYLQQLVDGGLAVVEGKGRGFKYRATAQQP